MCWFKRTDFKLKCDQTAQLAMIKKQINKKFAVIYFYEVLFANIGKSFSKFEQKGSDVLD